MRTWSQRSEEHMKYTRNQRCHLRSGALWSSYESLTGLFMVAFALALGANNMEIGLVGALPWMAMLLSQIPGVLLLEYYTRIDVYKVATVISRLIWIPICLVALDGVANPILVVSALFFFVKFSETLVDPSWATIMGDIVPKKVRGEFFGRRLWLTTLCGTITYVIGGFVLGRFPKDSVEGFVILFGTGILFGLGCTWVFMKIKEPKYVRDHDMSLFKFGRIDKEFKKFCIFAGLFYFAFMLAGPFYTVYMLKNLDMGYEFFVLAISVGTLAKLASQQWLGKLTDQIGEKKVGIWSVVALAFVPFAWMNVGIGNLWVIIPIQIVAGIAGAGFNVMMYNMEINLSKDRKRAISIAQYDMAIAVPLALAPITGGLIATNVVIGGLSGIKLVFVISSVLIVVSLVYMMRLKEPRAKKKVEYFASIEHLRQRRQHKHGGHHNV